MPPVVDPGVTEAVDEAAAKLHTLNSMVLNHTGSRALLPCPVLPCNVEELMQDPDPPVFPLIDDEDDFIKEVRLYLSHDLSSHFYRYSSLVMRLRR